MPATCNISTHVIETEDVEVAVLLDQSRTSIVIFRFSERPWNAITKTPSDDFGPPHAYIHTQNKYTYSHTHARKSCQKISFIVIITVRLPLVLWIFSAHEDKFFDTLHPG